MKKQYVTPRAKKVDFSYDEQVVASSVCMNYNIWSKDNTTSAVCTDELKDVPQLARITILDCNLYLDQAGL